MCWDCHGKLHAIGLHTLNDFTSKNMPKVSAPPTKFLRIPITKITSILYQEIRLLYALTTIS